MADGKDLDARQDEMDSQDNGDAGQGGKKRSFLLPIILVVIIGALGAGGYFGYKVMFEGKGESEPRPAARPAAKEGKTILFSMDPFVVNLAEPGRYLKVTMQFELVGAADEKSVNDKIPILRDVIITLVGNQTYEYVASAEGKIQLKEDILLRANRIFGREVFRNLYFTEFVMQ